MSEKLNSQPDKVEKISEENTRGLSEDELFRLHLRLIDSDEKALTARNPEDIMKMTNFDYETLFGLSKEKKAIREIFIVNGITDVSKIDEMFLEIDRKTRSLLGRDATDVSSKVFEETIKYYLSDAKIPDQSFINKFTDDQLLNIGDPYQKLGREIDEDRNYTIDYEYDTEISANSLKPVKEIEEKVMDAIAYGHKGQFFNTYNFGKNAVDEYLKNKDDPNIKKIYSINDWDIKWLYGYKDSQTGKHIMGLDDYIQKGLDLIEEIMREPNFKNFEKGIEIWEKIGVQLESRRKHISENIEARKSLSLGNGYQIVHPMDTISRSAFYAQKSAYEGLKAIYYYKRKVFWQVIKPHLKDLVEAHKELINEVEIDNKSVNDTYVYEWKKYLSQHGYEPDNYSFPEFGLYKNVLKFYLERGSDVIDALDPAIYAEIKNKEIKLMEKEFKARVMPKRAHILKGMFPFTDKIFEDNKFDRILASWSISTHMFHNMDYKDLVNTWKEMDRILKRGGKVIMFPVKFGFDMEKEIRETLLLYNQENNNIFDFEIKDDPWEEYKILVINKK